MKEWFDLYRMATELEQQFRIGIANGLGHDGSREYAADQVSNQIRKQINRWKDMIDSQKQAEENELGAPHDH